MKTFVISLKLRNKTTKLTTILITLF